MPVTCPCCEHSPCDVFANGYARCDKCLTTWDESQRESIRTAVNEEKERIRRVLAERQKLAEERDAAQLDGHRFWVAHIKQVMADRRRAAWRTYAAAALSCGDVSPRVSAEVADDLLALEEARFGRLET